LKFFDFGGVLDQNVLFSTFDLENYCQGQIFPMSQYEKGVVGEKLKSFELSHAQIGHLVWAVGVSKKKKKKNKACISSFNVKSYFVPTIVRYRGLLTCTTPSQSLFMQIHYE
jgi:hypothetical protein